MPVLDANITPPHVRLPPCFSRSYRMTMSVGNTEWTVHMLDAVPDDGRGSNTLMTTARHGHQ